MVADMTMKTRKFAILKEINKLKENSYFTRREIKGLREI